MNQGTIVTFYSYKGGVGRSMALANLALLLCHRGFNTLMVDWDLEAPGLERYFEASCHLNVQELLNRPGLGCMIQRYVANVAEPASDECSAPPFPPLDPYLYAVDQEGTGQLSLLHAGRRSPGKSWENYVDFVQSFDWKSFYSRWGGGAYLEWFRERLKERFDFVLIDSRTGVTEMGGVATQHLADAVVLLCGSNLQNIENSASMARHFASPQIRSARGDRPLELVVVPARIDDSDSAGYSEFLDLFSRSFADVPVRVFTGGYTKEEMLIPYLASLSYRETLVINNPRLEGSASRLVDAYTRVASHLELLAKPAGKAQLDERARTFPIAIGVDLGGTRTMIAHVDRSGKPEIIPNSEGERSTPTVVCFDGDQVLIGQIAKSMARLQPQAYVQNVKRHMGDRAFAFSHEGKTYRPEDIMALVLKKVISDAEASFGEPIDDVVITCPAYYSESQRRATVEAGNLAGKKVRAILNEPMAAVIAYGTESARDETILVYDLGGTSFNVALILVKANAIHVVGLGGDHNLGGIEWDAAIVRYLVHRFQEQTGSGEDILEDPRTRLDLFIQAERAKKTLSQIDRTVVEQIHQGRVVRVDLTRREFENLTAELLERTIACVRQMLHQQALARVDRILLVGGSTRMPQVRGRLKREFDIPCELSMNPDEVVARGAAIYALKLSLGDEISARQAGPEPHNLEASRKQVARRLGISTGTIERLSATSVVNISSVTIGVVVLAGNTTKIDSLIRRNDRLPVQVTRTFLTIRPSQEKVLLRIMESVSAEDPIDPQHATDIGHVQLQLPPGLPAGSAVDVTFQMNEQGILKIEAYVPSVGRSSSAIIESASAPSTQELEVAE